VADETDRSQPPKESSSVLSVLGSVVRYRPKAAISLMVISLIAGLSESMILALVAHAANSMVDGTDRLDAALGPVAIETRVPIALAVAGGLGVLRIGLQVILAYLPSRIAADAQADQRNRLFDAYSRASWEVQAKEHDGHLQELLTTQVTNATHALVVATNLVTAGLTFLTLVFAAFIFDPTAALLVLVVAASLAAVLRPIGKRGRYYSGRWSSALLDYAGAVGSAIRLAEETFTIGVAAAESARLRERVESIRHYYWRTQFTQRLTQGLYQGFVILLLVGGLAGLYASGTGRIASLGTVVLILVRSASYGQHAQVHWHVIQQAGPFLERLAAEEDHYSSNALSSGQRSFRAGTALELDSVSFEYRPGIPVLRGVTLDVAAGEVIGIVGSSGAGKSTLVQILLRMRQPTEGQVLLGGIPIDEISFDDWRRNVAYVPQEPRLLHASVAENIRFSRSFDAEQVEQAAQMANVHADILAMPNGYDTIIGQRADAVSGGQRQRICLARALVGRPTVLVLDEPTSALDSASEAAIQASLLKLRGDPTIFIVAHRPALLTICDRVIQIEGGSANVLPSAPHELGTQTQAGPRALP
jgi:ATP-binding cassette, subfamily B, bacterial